MQITRYIQSTILAILLLWVSYSTDACAQSLIGENIPAYTLPDPLIFANGKPVKTKKQWKERRAEILAMCEREMYGISPSRPDNIRFEIFEQNANALGGKATRKQITITIEDSVSFDVLVYYPNQVKGPVPVFLNLNFQGNHAECNDPAIRISPAWVWGGAAGAVNNRSTEASRGAVSSRWPVEMILARGYAAATVFANEIDPDYNDGFKNGVHALYPELQDRGDNFSTMGAWAWGLSRVMDYFETDPAANAKQVMLFGFSRMGKAALWAAARDPRFAMVFSNESGGGGAALSKRLYGEDVARLTRGNPHWFAANFKKYSGNEAALPFDQHMVISLIAPRPVYIASAELDPGADPYGEFLTAKAASPVYRFLGHKGLPEVDFPELHHPIFGDGLAYHIRAGKHDVKDYDWEQYLNYVDRFND